MLGQTGGRNGRWQRLARSATRDRLDGPSAVPFAARTEIVYEQTTMMRTVSVKLPERLDCRLMAMAKRRRCSRSQLLREALEAWLAQMPPLTIGELAADLIGSVEGPGDLSTNPKYMRGFGR